MPTSSLSRRYRACSAVAAAISAQNQRFRHRRLDHMKSITWLIGEARALDFKCRFLTANLICHLYAVAGRLHERGQPDDDWRHFLYHVIVAHRAGRKTLKRRQYYYTPRRAMRY